MHKHTYNTSRECLVISQIINMTHSSRCPAISAQEKSVFCLFSGMNKPNNSYYCTRLTTITIKQNR